MDRGAEASGQFLNGTRSAFSSHRRSYFGNAGALPIRMIDCPRSERPRTSALTSWIKSGEREEYSDHAAEIKTTG